MNEPQAVSPNNFQSKADHIGQPPNFLAAEEVLGLVVVRCGGTLYGIEMTWVREIRPFAEATPIYGLPEFWSGIAELRGQLFALLDLQKLLGDEAATTEKRRHVLFTAVNNQSIGLLVEEIVDLRQVDAEAITAGSTPDLPFLVGTTPDQIAILDLPGLFADPRLASPASQVNDAEV